MIRPIMNFADRYATKGLNKVFNTNFLKTGNDAFKGWSATTVVVVSLLSKDLVNCAYYVYQSLNNERIPEEKRKFVAAMDLANGIMNVAVQLIAAAPIKALGEKIYDKYLEKRLFNAMEKSRLQNVATQNGKNFVEQAVFDKAFKLNNKTAKAGFVAVVVLLGLQTFVKRVITPSIATPMASKLKPFLKTDKEIAAAATKQKNEEKDSDKTASDVTTAQPKAQNSVFSKFV